MNNKSKLVKDFSVISVAPAPENPDLNATQFRTEEIKDFFIMIGLAAKCLSEKLNIEYEDFSKTLIKLMREQEIKDYALNRIKQEEEDTLI